MAEATKRKAEAEAEPEESFEVGEAVVIREDFHSAYYRGMHATIAGPARKGGSSKLVWPLQIEKPPYAIVMHGKYLMRKADWEASKKASSGERPGGSLLGRLFPWKR